MNPLKVPRVVRLMYQDHEFDCPVLRGRFVRIAGKPALELLILVLDDVEYYIVEG